MESVYFKEYEILEAQKYLIFHTMQGSEDCPGFNEEIVLYN